VAVCCASGTQLLGCAPGSARPKGSCNAVEVSGPEFLIKGGFGRAQPGPLDFHGCADTGVGVSVISMHVGVGVGVLVPWRSHSITRRCGGSTSM
jgi:hypothetical protein